MIINSDFFVIIISSNDFIYIYIQYLLFVNNICEINIFGSNDKEKCGQLLKS